MLKSLKQLESASVALGSKLRLLSVFDGPEIVLEPGTWLVGLSGSAKWRHAPNVEVRIVLDGDMRSAVAPRVHVPNDDGPQMIVAEDGRPVRVAERVIPLRGFCTTGPVQIPEGNPVRVELMSAIRGIRNHGYGDDEKVEFAGVNLFALKIG